MFSLQNRVTEMSQKPGQDQEIRTAARAQMAVDTLFIKTLQRQ
ncbi:Uncharacterised protein [Edwardsiella tarda]|nr:Uncharacterised protein [Edwardsiella tarda]